MIGSDAVKRVSRGLGFRPDGNSLETQIAAAFQEAQDDLELGKTLPKFLRQENQSLSLTVGTHLINLPAGFARSDDDEPIHYTPITTTIPKFLQEKRFYKDALEAYAGSSFTTTGFKVYVIRNSTIEFIINAPTTTAFTWSYYKYAADFALGSENEWLAHKTAKWWLIGQVGYIIAQDLRDDRATQIFDGMRNRGRAATFGDMLAREDEGGPIVMGANL